MTAMIRNLGKMSAINLLKPLSSHSSLVCTRLQNVDMLSKARIHPFNVLVALKTYQQGHGEKGKLKWTVNPAISDALEKAFYLSFKVSDERSMSWGGLNSCKVFVLFVFLEALSSR